VSQSGVSHSVVSQSVDVNQSIVATVRQSVVCTGPPSVICVEGLLSFLPGSQTSFHPFLLMEDRDSLWSTCIHLPFLYNPRIPPHSSVSSTRGLIKPGADYWDCWPLNHWLLTTRSSHYTLPLHNYQFAFSLSRKKLPFSNSISLLPYPFLRTPPFHLSLTSICLSPPHSIPESVSSILYILCACRHWLIYPSLAHSCVIYYFIMQYVTCEADINICLVSEQFWCSSQDNTWLPRIR